MTRFLYSLLYLVLIPFILLRMWMRGASNPGYRTRWGERFAIFPFIRVKPVIWLHAVSVGETLAAVPVIKGLLSDYPDAHLVVTSTTPTGSDRVRAAFSAELEHGRLTNVFLPYDLPWLMNRFVNKIRPSLCIIMETELWPNMLAACEKYEVPALLANARLSEKSAKGYAKFSALTLPMLQRLSFVAAQSDADTQRFRQLGLADDRIAVTGNIKFDVSVGQDDLDKGQLLKQRLGDGRLVLTLASSHQGEDEVLIETYQKLKTQFPKLLLMIIPRHPERFDSVAELMKQKTLNYVRQSEMEDSNADQSVDAFLADSMGQMMSLLVASDLVVMGGSFIEHGGHNPLEPCALTKPVVIGDSYFNFAAVVEDLVSVSGIKVTTEADLNAVLADMLVQENKTIEMAKSGHQVVMNNQGGVKRLLEHCGKFLK